MNAPTTELREGAAAPDFALKDDAGKDVRLADFKGKTVVLYFYPKDDTPGCTVEACAFRDTLPDFKKRGAVILGVSPDGLESHKKFKAKHKLTFPLLSDPERKTASAYGAFGKKMMYGRETLGILRSTFVIGPDGRLEKIFRGVRADGHAEQVLGSLAASS
jgi:thioredoxin-dependent peroxiredoxin